MRLVAEENERRSDNKPRHYPKRPFMKPTLDTNRSRLPSISAEYERRADEVWLDAIREKASTLLAPEKKSGKARANY